MYDLKNSMPVYALEKLDLNQVLSTKLSVFKKEFADLYA